MTVKLLTEHHLEFVSLKSLDLSKCHIVGNHMSWLIIIYLRLRLTNKQPYLSTSIGMILYFDRLMPRQKLKLQRLMKFI